MARRRIFKIVLLGDKGVGKATFRKRYLGQGFRRNYGSVIGVNFAVKKLNNYLGENIIAQIWEIIPQDRFRYIRELNYKGSTGGILMFDISRKETLENLSYWVQEFKKFNDDNIVPLLIIGSKADLREKSVNAISREEAEKYINDLATEIGFELTYVETSIIENKEVDQGFNAFVDNITNSLIFSDQLIEDEVDKFLKKHKKRLKKDIAKYKKEQSIMELEEFTTTLDSNLMKKVNHLAKVLGLDSSILLNKIISDFFKK
jgi:small GTP-binding protein